MYTIHRLKCIHSKIEHNSTCCFSSSVIISEDTQIMYAIYWDQCTIKKRPFASMSIGDTASYICINTDHVITKWFTQPEARHMGMGSRLLHHVSIHHPDCQITLPLCAFKDPVLALCLRLGFKKKNTTSDTITLCS
jgi:hypothetical protein